MQESFELKAAIRTDMGKGASRRLRRQNLVPAVIYGAGKDPVSLTLAHNELALHLQHEAFYSHVLTIDVDGSQEKAVLKDVQRHPSAPIIMHIDLLRIDDSHKIHMSVPLHFLNEDICVGVKTGGGSITHLMAQVEVACLPKDLPEYIEIDLAEMNIGESVHMSDMKLPDGIELIELQHGHDLAVVSVLKPKGGGSADDDADGGDAPAEG